MQTKHFLLYSVILCCLLMSACSPSETTSTEKQKETDKTIFVKVEQYLEKAKKDTITIMADRKEELADVARYIKSKQDSNQTAKLMFICTHNSRRSHISQIWATIAAHCYDIKNVEAYSGGTEATAFNARAVATLRRAGLVIKNPEGDTQNSYYKVSFSNDGKETIGCFSKKYDHHSNPQDHFAAIMTCSQADESCPRVEGAEARFLVSYEDPKVADNTPQETQIYDARCRQIATEMLYIMSKVSG